MLQYSTMIRYKHFLEKMTTFIWQIINGEQTSAWRHTSIKSCKTSRPVSILMLEFYQNRRWTNHTDKKITSISRVFQVSPYHAFHQIRLVKRPQLRAFPVVAAIAESFPSTSPRLFHGFSHHARSTDPERAKFRKNLGTNLVRVIYFQFYWETDNPILDLGFFKFFWKSGNWEIGQKIGEMHFILQIFMKLV